MFGKKKLPGDKQILDLAHQTNCHLTLNPSGSYPAYNNNIISMLWYILKVSSVNLT